MTLEQQAGSAAGLCENRSCDTAQPMAGSQAPGRGQRAWQGSRGSNRTSGCSLGRQGVYSALSRHATPRVAASPVTLETSPDPARATRAQQRNKGGMERPCAPGRETVSAGPRSERGRFLPRASSSSRLTLCCRTAREKQAAGGTARSHPASVGSQRFA